LFGYSVTNALKSVEVNSGSWSGTEGYTYDAVGNLTYRSDLGVMTYGPAGGGGVPAAKVGITGTVAKIGPYQHPERFLPSARGRASRRLASYDRPRKA
jgi:hypothetical protein